MHLINPSISFALCWFGGFVLTEWQNVSANSPQDRNAQRDCNKLRELQLRLQAQDSMLKVNVHASTVFFKKQMNITCLEGLPGGNSCCLKRTHSTYKHSGVGTMIWAPCVTDLTMNSSAYQIILEANVRPPASQLKLGQNEVMQQENESRAASLQENGWKRTQPEWDDVVQPSESSA